MTKQNDAMETLRCFQRKAALRPENAAGNHKSKVLRTLSITTWPAAAVTPPTGSRMRALSAEVLRVCSFETFKAGEAEDDAEDKSSSVSPCSGCGGVADGASREAAQISR